MSFSVLDVIQIVLGAVYTILAVVSLILFLRTYFSQHKLKPILSKLSTKQQQQFQNYNSFSSSPDSANPFSESSPFFESTQQQQQQLEQTHLLSNTPPPPSQRNEINGSLSVAQRIFYCWVPCFRYLHRIQFAHVLHAFFGLIFIVCVVRLLEFFIAEFFSVEKSGGIAFIVDTIPTCVFIAVELILIYSWAKVFHQTQNQSNLEATLHKLKTIFITLNTLNIILFSLLDIFLMQEFAGTITVESEYCGWTALQIVTVCFGAVVFLSCALGFALYGGFHFMKLQRIAIRTALVQTNLRRVGVVTVLCSLCFVLRSALVLFQLHFAENCDGDHSLLVTSIFMITYYSLCEILPICLTMYVLYTLSPSKSARRFSVALPSFSQQHRIVTDKLQRKISVATATATTATALSSDLSPVHNSSSSSSPLLQQQQQQLEPLLLPSPPPPPPPLQQRLNEGTQYVNISSLDPNDADWMDQRVIFSPHLYHRTSRSNSTSSMSKAAATATTSTSAASTTPTAMMLPYLSDPYRLVSHLLPSQQLQQQPQPRPSVRKPRGLQRVIEPASQQLIVHNPRTQHFKPINASIKRTSNTTKIEEEDEEEIFTIDDEDDNCNVEGDMEHSNTSTNDKQLITIQREEARNQQQNLAHRVLYQLKQQQQQQQPQQQPQHIVYQYNEKPFRQYFPTEIKKATKTSAAAAVASPLLLTLGETTVAADTNQTVNNDSTDSIVPPVTTISGSDGSLDANVDSDYDDSTKQQQLEATTTTTTTTTTTISPLKVVITTKSAETESTEAIASKLQKETLTSNPTTPSSKLQPSLETEENQLSRSIDMSSHGFEDSEDLD